MNKQTAVEYLLESFEQFYGSQFRKVIDVQIALAKAMEREQVERAWCNGAEIYDDSAAQYYRDTYKGGEQ